MKRDGGGEAMKMKLTLGERLADLRYSIKVTQAEAARGIDTKKTSLAHWETNKNKPGIKTHC